MRLLHVQAIRRCLVVNGVVSLPQNLKSCCFQWSNFVVAVSTFCSKSALCRYQNPATLVTLNFVDRLHAVLSLFPRLLLRDTGFTNSGRLDERLALFCTSWTNAPWLGDHHCDDVSSPWMQSSKWPLHGSRHCESHFRRLIALEPKGCCAAVLC